MTKGDIMDIRVAVEKAVGHHNLTEEETQSVFSSIMDGEATPAQIAAFIVALRMKGETVDEITGAARAMRKKALKVSLQGINTEILDTCGTGGSGLHAFNVSTVAAFVIAGCGVKVAKHGNRSATSMCGSADVLEKLGVKIDVSVEVTQDCINKINIGFMFAPLYHKAMKFAAVPRKEIGVRTIFNIIGPLANPAFATTQVLGVYDTSLTEAMAEVLGRLGVKRAFVVSGEDGLDEITTTAITKVSELNNGEVNTYFVEPKTFGMDKASLSDIKGGTTEENAEIAKAILQGEKGPRRDIVLMNASLGLVAAGKAGDFIEGVKMAADSIDSGRAMEKLEALIKMTSEGAG